MNKPPEPKKAGRPALPPELKRTARLLADIDAAQRAEFRAA